MKRKKSNMSVRELFRKQLWEAEVVPGDAFEKQLMRKLSAREFTRFIPSKFNMYYLAGILAVGLTTGLLIFSGKEAGSEAPLKSTDPDTIIIESKNPVTIAANPILPGTTNETKSPVQDPILKSSEITSSKETEKPENKTDSGFSKGDQIPLASGLPVEELPDNVELISGYQIKDADYPVAGFTMSSVTGCLPLKIRFTNSSSNYNSSIWSFGDGGTSVIDDPEWIFDEEGTYRISLTVTNSIGLKSVITDSITVNPKPQALFEISPNDAVIPDDEIHFLNYSSNAVSFNWDFGDGNKSEDFEPVYRYSSNGRYDVTLIARSEFGCTDTLVIENAFAGSSNYIDFPNAFIPNTGGPIGGSYSSKSDETAQIFHPVTSGVTDYQLRIFSKRGILIFESSDVGIGWDGYYRSQLCDPGVYIWKVRGKLTNGEPFVKMGDVIILKN